MAFKERTSEYGIIGMSKYSPSNRGARRWPFSPFLSDWFVLDHFVSGIIQDKNRDKYFILNSKDLGRWVFEL